MATLLLNVAWALLMRIAACCAGSDKEFRRGVGACTRRRITVTIRALHGKADSSRTAREWASRLNGNASIVAKATLHLASTLDIRKILAIAVSHLDEGLSKAPFAIAVTATSDPLLSVGGGPWTPALMKEAERFLLEPSGSGWNGCQAVVVRWDAGAPGSAPNGASHRVAGFHRIPLEVEGRVIGAIGASLPRGAASRRSLAMLEALALPLALSLRNALDHAALKGLAFRDCLTGLFNRRAFEEMLEAQTSGAKRYGRPLSILAFDVDGLKEINDRLGHEAGDAVLRELARVLALLVRRSDLPARTGGDEFAVILPDTARASAERLSRRLSQEMCCRVEIGDGVAVDASVSVGVASVDDGADVAPKALLRSADEALYASKRRRAAGADRALNGASLTEESRHGL